MMTTCPTCKYSRKPTDTAPAYRCPRCGQNYPEEGAQPVASPATVAERTAWQDSAPISPAHDQPLQPVQQPPRAKGADEKFCADCGEIIKSKAEICPKCGVRQLPPPELQKARGDEKQKFVAGLLALFLGGLGIHKFYLGKGGQGLIYILFCWTFIPAFLGLIEGLNYLTMSQQVFDERYNNR